MATIPGTSAPVAGGDGRARRLAPCCPPVLDRPLAGTPVGVGTVRVVLVGNPNVGKSTVFNAATGAHQTVGNWPGKTVHVATGFWRRAAGGGGPDVELVDLPGTYSLVARSPEEEFTRDLLVDRGLAGRPALGVVVVDAANLGRTLYLLAQVLDAGLPVVVALGMLDVAERRGIQVDADALAHRLGVPVVPVRPRERRGIDGLAAAVSAILAAPPRHVPHPDLGPVLEPAITAVAQAATTDPSLTGYAPRWLALELLTEAGGVAASASGAAATADRVRPDLLAAIAAEEPGGQAGEDVAAQRADQPADLDVFDLDAAVAERRYDWVHQAVATSVTRPADEPATRSDRADRLLLSRWLGIPVFLAVMWAVFEATTRLAAPLQDRLSSFLSGPVSDTVAAVISGLGLGHTWVRGLVVDGLVSGVGQLLTFVPLMAIMFVVLALLEDSGYLARAAVLADRFLRRIGLPGKAFLPLVVGFGCNVPAIAGTRILADRRQRLLTALLVPFTSCSARLTVYVLLADVFFGSRSGTVVFAMYVVSVVLVVLVGLALRRTLFRGQPAEPLVLELPAYRLPTPRVVGTQTWQRLRGFLRTASGIIVATVTAVWLASAIPLGGGHRDFGSVPVENSLFAGVSRTVAPAFAPAGFADWHESSALVTGFVAKEAVISTFAQTYGAQQPSRGHAQGTPLAEQLKVSFATSSGGHTTAAVLAFLVFLLAYTPCMTTIATQRAEIGTRWALVGVGLQLGIAWLLAVAVFQIGALVV